MSMGSELTRTNRERFAVGISFPVEEKRTKEAFAEESDINNIMARYKRSGVIDHLAYSAPMYGDFDNAIDYMDAKNRLIAADESFNALAAHIRDRFGNDPGRLITFMSDMPANEKEAQELGLLTKPSDPPRKPAPGPGPTGGTASEPTAPPPQPTPIAGGE